MAFSVNSISSETRWEEFILSHCPAALFQSWRWGEVQAAQGVKVWRIGLFDQRKLLGVVQITKTVAKRGNFLHLRHGPVFLNQQTKTWNALLAYVTKLGRQEGCWFIRVSPLIEDCAKNRLLFQKLHFRPAPIHAMDAELCWVLDLDKTEDELLGEMRKTTRYEIKRAPSLGIQVTRSQSPADLKVFLRLYQETTARHGFVPHHGIVEEFKVFTAKDRALLWLGRIGQKIMAGAIILFSGNQAIYHHGASQWSKLPVSSVLQWEAIKEAKHRGYKLYNFWGIAPDDKQNHPWRGITLFKKGFGGREVKYVHAQDLAISPFYAIPKAIESVRRIIKGY